MMGTAQTRSSHSNVSVQEATLEPTVKPTSMNVKTIHVGMVEHAEMVSVPTSVNAWTDTLEKTVKAVSTNADQTPVKMVVPVKMMATFTSAPAQMVTWEHNARQTLMIVDFQTPANMVEHVLMLSTPTLVNVHKTTLDTTAPST